MILLRKLHGVLTPFIRQRNALLAGVSPPSVAATLGGLATPFVLLLVALVFLGAWAVATGVPDLTALAIPLAGTTGAAVVEKREQFATKQKELAEIIEAAQDGPNRFDLTRKAVQEKLGAVDAADAHTKIKARNRELDMLGQELQAAELNEVKGAIAEREGVQREPVRGGIEHPVGDPNEAKTFGQRFVESKTYLEGYRKQGIRNVPVEVEGVGIKTLFQTTAGFPPESRRSGLVVEKADLSLAELIRLIPAFPIDQPNLVYMEETTRTHGAVEVAEGVAYTESTFVYEEKSSPVRKIGDFLPVTDEQLQDVNFIRSLLDQRLRYGVMKRLAGQILNGNGTPPNLRGILNVVGIQTQAKGTDSVMAAAYKAMTKVRFTGDAEPSAFVFHPNDWSDVVLSQESTGGFLWGHPAFGPMTQLWGLPVALSTGIVENTALVADFINFTRLDEKKGIEVQAGYIGDQFKEGKISLRADIRTAFTLTRPAAACTITGV